MPTGKEMLELEQLHFESFNDRMQSFCSEKKLAYLDLTSSSSKYKYTDGNHLHSFSSKQFTKDLAQILQNK
jgi:hypothetical protein